MTKHLVSPSAQRYKVRKKPSQYNLSGSTMQAVTLVGRMLISFKKLLNGVTVVVHGKWQK